MMVPKMLDCEAMDDKFLCYYYHCQFSLYILSVRKEILLSFNSHLHKEANINFLSYKN